MNIEILLYDGFDELDALGPWEVLSEIARARDGVDAALVTLEPAREVLASHGTVVHSQRALAETPDLVIVPGGGWIDRSRAGAWREVERGALPAALRERHGRGTIVASVCTGALVVAAAGLLTGRPATTNHAALDDLRARGAHVVAARVVDDGDVVTAGGVTCGLDLVLWLVERFFGAPLAHLAERELEYERRGTVWRATASV